MLSPSPKIFFHVDRVDAPSQEEKRWSCRGWAFVENSFLAGDVRLKVGGSAVLAASRQPRPDVALHYPGQAAAAYCGFAVTISTAPELPMRLEIQGPRDEWFEFWIEPSASCAPRGEKPRSLPRFSFRPLLASAKRIPKETRGGDTTIRERAPPSSHPSPSRPAPPVTTETGPLISILVPVFNPPERYLREMFASVQAQDYSRWELCLADDASTDPHVGPILSAFARQDPRVRVIHRATNGHISRATNSALQIATGEFVALLDHDDLLAPTALSRVAEALRGNKEARFVYTDRDKIDDAGRHFDVERRGSWNPAMAITHNYLHQFTVIQRELMLRNGGFRAEYFGAQDLDLYLRLHEQLSAREIVHVPAVAYHWRAHPGSTATRGDQKDYMFESARRGIADALHRRGLQAEPFLPDFAREFGLNLHQLRWSPKILAQTPVSVVALVRRATRALAKEYLAQLAATVPAASVEFIVASSAEANAGDNPMSPAALFNQGASRARHPLLLLIDLGTLPQSTGWLEDLAGWLSVPQVDAAGPKLVGPDRKLHSAGWTVRAADGLPGPAFAGAAVDELDPLFLIHAARDCLALDAACLLTRTALFRELGGYDHARFPHTYFAADYCLRLRERGSRIVFSPQAQLFMIPLAKPSHARPLAEEAAFRQRHPQVADPWLNPDERTPRRPEFRAEPDASLHARMPAGTVEFAEGWFHLETNGLTSEPSSNPEPFRLSGWCLPRPGRSIVQLRLLSPQGTVDAIYGFPRPDVAAHLSWPGNLLPIGFDLEPDLPAGRMTVTFEALAAGAGWQRITTLELNLPTRIKRSPPCVDAPQYFTTLEMLLLRTPAETPIRGEEEQAIALAQILAPNEMKRLPWPPFHGYCESPIGNVPSVYGCVGFVGWFFHEHLAIRRVLATFDFIAWQELDHRRPRPDVAKAYPAFAAAQNCGVEGDVLLPAELPSPHELRLYAELEDGSWHLIGIRRWRAHVIQPNSQPLVHGVRWSELISTAWRFRSALRRAGAVLPSVRSMANVLVALQREFPATRPARRTPRAIAQPQRRNDEPHVLVVTHNLNREGAPLFLLEIVRRLLARSRVRLTVIAPTDGPVRGEFEDLGGEVRLIDRSALWSARTRNETRRALETMRRELRAETASLVIASTIESFWAIEAAHRGGVPSLLYVHEAGVIGYPYLRSLGGHARREASAALARSTVVSFPSYAVRAYYEPFSECSHYRVQPGWTDLAVLEGRRYAEQRTKLRQQLGVGENERIILTVGTLCARKGQLVFVHAAEHLWHHEPNLAARCRFMILGDGDNNYGTQLAADVKRLARANLTLHPATDRIADYFAAADLFVLTSFEEGFPRVLLEAMAFGLPIVSTAIHAIPEIVQEGWEAILIPPGNPRALACALKRLLRDPMAAKALGQAARARVNARFSAHHVIPGHLKTIAQIAPDLALRVPKTPVRDWPEPIPANF